MLVSGYKTVTAKINWLAITEGWATVLPSNKALFVGTVEATPGKAVKVVSGVELQSSNVGYIHRYKITYYMYFIKNIRGFI